MSEFLHVNSACRDNNQHPANAFTFDVNTGYDFPHSRFELFEIVLPRIKDAKDLPFVYLHINRIPATQGKVESGGIPIPIGNRNDSQERYKSGIVVNRPIKQSGTLEIILSAANNEPIQVEGEWGFTLRLLK